MGPATGGRELFQRYTTKFNNQGKGLNMDDLGGAVKEKFGLSSNGQHLKEVTDAASGMRKEITNMFKDIVNGKFEGDILEVVYGMLTDTLDQYQEIKQALKSADDVVKSLR